MDSLVAMRRTPTKGPARAGSPLRPGRPRPRRPAALDLAGKVGNRAIQRLVQRASLTVYDGDAASSAVVYRAGTTFVPGKHEYKTTLDGRVKPTHGVSVHTDPPGLEKRIKKSLGSWYELESIPVTLKIKQRGQDKKHYEVMSAMDPWPTVKKYTDELAKITVKSTAATFG